MVFTAINTVYIAVHTIIITYDDHSYRHPHVHQHYYDSETCGRQRGADQVDSDMQTERDRQRERVSERQIRETERQLRGGADQGERGR